MQLSTAARARSRRRSIGQIRSLMSSTATTSSPASSRIAGKAPWTKAGRLRMAERSTTKSKASRCSAVIWDRGGTEYSNRARVPPGRRTRRIDRRPAPSG
jgi:hypothetical protein